LIFARPFVEHRFIAECVTGPTRRIRGKDLAEKVDLVKETAQQITANLGNRSSWFVA
jgi:hypothetical protein